MNYPKVFRVRQHFDSTRLDDVAATVRRELESLDLQEQVRPGQSVAVPVGSRGIANLAEITRAIVDYFQSIGARPFIVPAMGSHGSSTAEGQRAVLESYGVTEASVGCPIRSCVETVVLGRTPQGFDIHFDRIAYEADHRFLFNRIKPHTSFTGSVESGLMKMLLIGLGNPEGARTYHRAIRQFTFDEIIRGTAPLVWEKCPVLGGLAIVENAYDETMLLKGVRPEAFEPTERDLLTVARENMPRLPFDTADLLLIDRIGKDISGTGLDTNVVGRKTNDHRAADDEWPKIGRILLRGLSPASHGNAIGIGIAEFCRSRVLREADWEATRLNVLSSGRVSAAMAALDYETDQDVLDVALKTVGLAPPEQVRLLWIADTLHLAEVECAEIYLDEARNRSDLEILTPPRNLPWDADGNLPDLGYFS